MTRANTPELVGMSCVIEDTPPGLMLCDKTLRLKVIERVAPAEYVDIVLGMPEVRRQIEIAATGTSGSMKNISQRSIKQLTIPLAAPADLARMVSADALCREQISAHRAEVKRLQLLKQGLMEDLLTGQVRV
jgi:type I restriction enzyme, S subunit